MADDAVLVGSGSFKVDRSRALDKLMRFQLADARMYLLPWVQAAVAGGAERIAIRPQSGGLEMTFDGRPWTGRDLADPYHWLFDEDPDGSHARNRSLAVGLLSALRLEPREIRVAAWSRGATAATLRVFDAMHETFEDAGESGIVEDLALSEKERCFPIQLSIRVLLQDSVTVSVYDFSAELAHVKRACRHCPAPIELNGELANPPRARGRLQVGADFAEGSVSGSLELSSKTLDESVIDLVTYGVSASAESLRLPAVQVRGYVRNDSFRKSISQMGIIKDELYEKSLDLVRRQAERLLLRSLGDLSMTSQRVGQALRDSSLRWRWMPWAAHGLGETVLQGFSASEAAPEAADEQGELTPEQETAEAVTRMSLIAAAARETCVARKDEMMRDADDPVLQSLWSAPLLFDTRRRPLSLRQLLEQLRWLGGVPYSSERNLDVTCLAALILREEDLRFLERFFGPDLRPLGAVEEADRKVLAPVLQEDNLLVRVPFRMPPVSGEIGLSVAPHPRCSHIRWIRRGRPLSVSTWALDGLRLEAAVDNPSLGEIPKPGRLDAAVEECLNSLRAMAPEAYRRLAQSYDPRDLGPRQAIIREHLLDLAAASWDPTRDRWKANEWLETLALFRNIYDRMVSMQDLREMAAKDQRTTLRSSPHPAAFQELALGYPDHMKALFSGSGLIAGIAPPPGAEPAPDAPARIRPHPPLDLPGERKEGLPMAARTSPPAAPVPDAPGARPPEESPGGGNADPPDSPRDAVRPEPGSAVPEREAAAPESSYQDLVATPAAAPAALSAAGTAAEENGPAAELKRRLQELSRRKACPLAPEQIERLRFASSPGRDILLDDPAGPVLNTAHPLVRALEADGGLASRIPFLISILITALHRAGGRISADQDVKCQLALAEILLDPGTGS